MTKRTKKSTSRIIDGVPCSPRGIPLTRCSNTLTEARFFAFILSHCRRITIKWKPKNDKLQEGKRPYTGTDKRTKFEYSCEICNGWFKGKDIEIDHIVPCGGINSFTKIAGWFERALCEVDGFQRLCKSCHNTKTQKERNSE